MSREKLERSERRKSAARVSRGGCRLREFSITCDVIYSTPSVESNAAIFPLRRRPQSSSGSSMRWRGGFARPRKKGDRTLEAAALECELENSDSCQQKTSATMKPNAIGSPEPTERPGRANHGVNRPRPIGGRQPSRAAAAPRSTILSWARFAPGSRRHAPARSRFR